MADDGLGRLGRGHRELGGLVEQIPQLIPVGALRQTECGEEAIPEAAPLVEDDDAGYELADRAPVQVLQLSGRPAPGLHSERYRKLWSSPRLGARTAFRL